MRVLMLLIAFILCISACDEATMPPITGIIPPSDVEDIPPAQGSVEKAQAAIERVNERRAAAHQEAEETGDFSTVFTASETIFKEELGFRKGFWVELVEIYRQENFENPALLEGLENLEDAFIEKLKADTLGMFYFTYIRAFDELIVEYLRLSFEFPESSEEQRLALFRESVTDEAIVITFP